MDSALSLKNEDNYGLRHRRISFGQEERSF